MRTNGNLTLGFLHRKGGAIATDAASVLDIDFTSFSKNEGAEGGAIYTAEYGELSVSRSVFEENFAILGGAIFTSGVATIDESTFKDNTGVEGVSRGNHRSKFTRLERCFSVTSHFCLFDILHVRAGQSTAI